MFLHQELWVLLCIAYIQIKLLKILTNIFQVIKQSSFNVAGMFKDFFLNSNVNIMNPLRNFFFRDWLQKKTILCNNNN